MVVEVTQFQIFSRAVGPIISAIDKDTFVFVSDRVIDDIVVGSFRMF